MSAQHDERDKQHELRDQLNQAVEGTAVGSRWPALSYEEGVMATLMWVLGCTDEKPMEDDGHE